MLEQYLQRFRKIQDHNRVPRWRKRCMLLAVIELAERGALPDNEIRYASPLLDAYRRYFAAIEGHDEGAEAHDPFFYLKKERFWHLKPRPGRASELDEMVRPTSERRVKQNVDHAALDTDLHLLLQEAEARGRLREAVCHRWSSGVRNRVTLVTAGAKAARDRQADSYRPQIELPPSDVVSDGPFRRAVLAAYDYRCAASGWRLIVPGGAPGPTAAPLIDVVRLMPRNEAGSDEERFGMALTPTWSRAFRAGLVAPGPDMTWRVAPIFESRVPDNAPLLDLAGRDVIFTGDPKHRPARRALEWSVARLRTTRDPSGS